MIIGIDLKLPAASSGGMFCLTAVLCIDRKEFCLLFDSLSNPAACEALLQAEPTGNALAVAVQFVTGEFGLRDKS